MQLLLALVGLAGFFAGIIVGQWLEARQAAARAAAANWHTPPRKATPRRKPKVDKYEALQGLAEATEAWLDSIQADEQMSATARARKPRAKA